MAAITGTLVDIGGSAMSGDGEKLIAVDCTPTTNSDTVTLTLASHGIRSIATVIACEITAGADAALQTASATSTGLVITLNTYAAAGTAATDWTGANVRIVLLGKM
jgi:hypothetical protein